MDKLFAKLGVSAGASVAVVESAGLEGLWNVLTTLAISLLTVLLTEGLAWLKSWLKAKRAKADAEAKKYNQEDVDETVQTVEAIEENKKEE